MTAVTFDSSARTKNLADALSLNDNAYVMTGTDDPSSVAKDAPRGSLYIRTGASGGLVYRKTDDGSSTNWVILGSGSSVGINHILNGDAESNTDGWAAFADAAGTSPVDGTGGSPTVTFTRSTSSPLRGSGSFLLTKDAANRQGEGASYAFTTATADQAKMHRISFNLSVASGTFVSGDSSDVRVWIYDVTNSVLIQPAPYTIQSSSGFAAVFQTNGNSTSYRLIFHCATTSAAAYVLKLDDIIVSPLTQALSGVATDWVSYTPTWASDGVQPVLNDGLLTGKWRRVGDSMDVVIRLSIGAGTTVGSGNYSWTIPSGYAINDAKLPQTALDSGQCVGVANIVDAGTSDYVGTVSAINATTIQVRVDANPNLVGANVPMVPATSDIFVFNFCVPITGWSNALALSQDTDGRVVAMRATHSAAQSIPTGVFAILNFENVTVDTHGSLRQGVTYNAGAGTWATDPRYTFAVSGKYIVHSKISFAANATGARTILIRKNGSSYSRAPVIASGSYGISTDITEIVDAIAGDYVDIQVLQDTGGALALAADSTANTFLVERAPGAVGVVATESVIARAGDTSASNVLTATDTTIVFDSEQIDTHGAFNNATGVFTCPGSGTFSVASKIQLAGGAWAAGEILDVKLFKNNVHYTTLGSFISQATASTNVSAGGKDLVKCNAGDTLKIVVYQDSGGTCTIDGGTFHNHIAIVRVGL